MLTVKDRFRYLWEFQFEGIFRADLDALNNFATDPENCIQVRQHITITPGVIGGLSSMEDRVTWASLTLPSLRQVTSVDINGKLQV